MFQKLWKTKNCERQEIRRNLHTITRAVEDLVDGVTVDLVVLVDSAAMDVLVIVDMLVGKVDMVDGITVFVVVDGATLLVDMGWVAFVMLVSFTVEVSPSWHTDFSKSNVQSAASTVPENDMKQPYFDVIVEVT